MPLLMLDIGKTNIHIFLIFFFRSIFSIFKKCNTELQNYNFTFEIRCLLGRKTDFLIKNKNKQFFKKFQAFFVPKIHKGGHKSICMFSYDSSDSL